AAQIAATERELAAAGQQLSDPELYRDGERTKAARARYERAQERLDDLYRQLAALESVNG
ncbi:MAG TPA: ABC transporter C-terminal domain-containing protein, partial [bacterium]|nr:ABC transporter C-terminal domain-containing protein [bacterium]